jgi:putative ABC transport system ATP-binding protein
MYVHQTHVNHRGTPAEFYFACQSFASQRARPRGDLPALIYQLGLEQEVLNQEWSQLSVSLRSAPGPGQSRLPAQPCRALRCSGRAPQLTPAAATPCRRRPLQGGQAQRVSLAIAIALCPSFLLLDEPTSACDTASALKVERALRECGAGVIWVTHDAEQPIRVGGRAFELPRGVEVSIPRPAAGG